jgi:hypothetical protein
MSSLYAVKILPQSWNKVHSLFLETSIANKFFKIERPVYDHDIEFPSISVFIRRRQDPPSRIGLASVRRRV